MKARLSPGAVKIIEDAVDEIFNRAKTRLLGRYAGGKTLAVGFLHELTLPGVFEAAAAEEGVKPSEDVLNTVLKIAGNYLDASKLRAKAKIVHGVQSFITGAAHHGVPANVETVLGGQLSKLWVEITNDVSRIIQTETTQARNLSIMDGIVRVNAAAGVEDPNVFFVVVRDISLCPECRRLHLNAGGTPRVYKLSEVGHGYHKPGEDDPKVGGLHPLCRCVLTTLMPGYGFNKDGMVEYKGPGHDEYAKQNS